MFFVKSLEWITWGVVAMFLLGVLLAMLVLIFVGVRTVIQMWKDGDL